MMPGRTRRVRLLAVALCVVTIFFLYTRNSGSVEDYTGYFTQSPVGGGSVLRSQEQQKSTPPKPVEPISPVEPVSPVQETKPAFLPQTTKAEDAVLPLKETTTQKAIIVEPTTTAAPPQPTTAKANPWEDVVNRLQDKLPYEVNLGNVESALMDHIGSASGPALHWTKFPEKFPISSTIQLPTSKPSAIPLIQKEGNAGLDRARLAAVKEATEWAWKGFREYGWGHDEVKPISGGAQNSFNGWGATLVDSLDTLWIMGMTDEFDEAVNKTAEIDFTTSSRSDIPLFEVTIRYLGGMIAAYDISGRQQKYQVLLDKAVELAEILYSAFDTPNRMPDTYYKWKPTYSKNPHRAGTRVVMAELGTLSLEFTRLAQLTGEPKYYDAIARITDGFEEWQKRTRVPGMWPTLMDASGCKRDLSKTVSSLDGSKKAVGEGVAGVKAASDKSTTGSKAATSQKAGGMGLSSQYKSAPGDTDADHVDTHNTGAYLKGTHHDEMGTVANPMAANIHAADSSANLRHSMDEIEHPLNKESGDLAEKMDSFGKPSTPGIDAKAPSLGKNEKSPLPPKAEAANVQTDPKVAPYGDREHEPLPAKGSGESPILKRQLDQVAELPAGVKRPSDEAPFKQDVRDTETQSVLDLAKDDECIPQGFESVSKNSEEAYSLGGMSDSTYEYLPKMHLLLGGRSSQYMTMYLNTMKPIINKLLYRPMTPDNADILISGMLRSSVNFTTGEHIEELIAEGQHLTCFVGGMFAMGGKIFDLPDHVEIGRKLTDGCVWTYNATKSGIMPEVFEMTACDSKANCKWNETLYHERLDPMFGFREEQRQQYKEDYNITDLVAFEQQYALQEAAGAAAASAKVAVPAYAEENSIIPGIPNVKPNDLQKRQLMDAAFTGETVAAPQPASPPIPPTKVEPAADLAANPAAPLPAKITAQAVEAKPYGSALYEADEPEPIWTPAPPMTHEAYVQNKIHDQALPAGFTRIAGRAYILRPEAIESVFYMYRITGDQYWRDMGWKMFVNIDKATKAKYGYASVGDVTDEKPEQHDKMESFWIAETLKYFYLLFDEPATWSLDDWVLNTEAHFFRRPAPAAAA